MIRTFIDSGVLIQAIRGEEKLANKALEILEDTNREFASSIFLKMEVLPKAIYNNQPGEVQFYQEYFESVTYWAMDINQIILNAYREASQYGLGAMDALHIASALSLKATEFITSEKVNKSIHRTPSIHIISIYGI
jgi:predicted nucleic acid-binding protein